MLHRIVVRTVFAFGRGGCGASPFERLFARTISARAPARATRLHAPSPRERSRAGVFPHTRPSPHTHKLVNFTHEGISERRFATIVDKFVCEEKPATIRIGNIIADDLAGLSLFVFLVIFVILFSFVFYFNALLVQRLSCSREHRIPAPLNAAQALLSFSRIFCLPVREMGTRWVAVSTARHPLASHRERSHHGSRL